jgi:3-dehydroquinate dehydratase-2
MKIAIINGPNINLIGDRETAIYGQESFKAFYNNSLVKKYPKVNFSHFQSNIEGEIIDKLQEYGYSYDGIILNAAAYTHTSVGIADAVKAIKTLVIEVHISNVWARESYRHTSFLSANVSGVIAGFGLKSYELALLSFFK